MHFAFADFVLLHVARELAGFARDSSDDGDILILQQRLCADRNRRASGATHRDPAQSSHHRAMTEASKPTKPLPLFDPMAQPWIPMPTEAPLPAELLTSDAIQSRLLQSRVPAMGLVADAPDLIAAQPPLTLRPIPAAVLMPIMMRGNQASMLLTQRSANLNHHAGQISFPGGRAESSDADLVATALRESYEEIGLQPNQVRILGALPQYLTITGFAVTPVAAWVDGDPVLAAETGEVAEIFEVPLAYVLDPANYKIHSAQLGNGVNRQYYSVSWDKYFIWGATAAMLRNFYLALRPPA